MKNTCKAREKLLKNNNVKKLEEVAVIGIIKDENLHRELLEKLEVKVKRIEYEIKNIVESDTFVEVTALETVIYTNNKEKTQCETEHIVTLMRDKNENWKVVSDAYFEEVTEFISCSYVPEGGMVSTFALSDTEVPRIVRVAETQVGYLEKETNSNLENFTANAGMNTFDAWGRFYASSAYGGSYTPKPGDIFFTGVEGDAQHTGIVASISGTTMYVIDGNCDNAVRKHPMAITDPSLLGFATSCVHNAGVVQKYNISYHWNACSVCDISVFIKTAHTFNTFGKCKFCPASQASTAALIDSLLME